MLKVILRTCDKVDSFSGPKRMKPKAEVVKTCFNSLLKSLSIYQGQKELLVVDDSSSEETLNFIRPSIKDGNLFSFQNLSNSGSLIECYKLADTMPDDSIIFFIEDDYLLHPYCIDEMMFLYNKTGHNSRYILHPVDYPDRYKDLYDCQVILGKSIHWRTIKHTTGTFMLPKSIYKEYRHCYQKFTEYGITPGINEDNSINLVYKDIPCLSPLPSLGHHYQYQSTLSPFLDADKLWNENR